MSKSKFLKPLAVIVLGGFVGFYSVHFLNSQPSGNNRYLASATMSKLGSEQLAKTMFDLKITNESLANTKDGVSTVRVVLSSYQKIPAGLTYSWNLPENATVVEGALNGTIAEIDTNQTQQFEIKVKGYSHEFKNHVVFRIKGDVNQSLIDQNVIVSSRPEDSFEYIVQQYEKTKSVEAKAKNKLGQSTYKAPIDPKKVVF